MMHFLPKARLVFIFLKNYLKIDFASPLIFVYFFKMENKIRNKNPSETHFLEKINLRKTKSKFGGHVTYWEGKVVSCSSKPLKSGLY